MKPGYRTIFVLGCLAVAVVWICAICVTDDPFKVDSLEPLFTGLAFVGIITAFLLQLRDISDREKKDNLEHFEQRLFQIMDALRLVVANFVSLDPYDKATGKGTFRSRFLNLGAMQDDPLIVAKGNFAVLMSRYERTYDVYQHDLGPYFRLLYHLLKSISESDMPKKREYSGIIRAELSSFEVQFLALNCLGEFGGPMKPFVESYTFLKHMPKIEINGIPDADALVRSRFDPSAFKEPTDAG